MKKFHEKPNRYVNEVGIRVTDLERSLAYYQEVIGFNVLYKTNREAALTADGKTALLYLYQPENAMPKEKRTAGLYHFALLLPSRSHLANFLTHLIDAGVRIGASDHKVSEALYLEDPDGNGIEVYRDRSASDWQWQAGHVMMTTDPLDGEGLLKESDAEWDGLPEQTIMGHIHLHVSNLEKTEHFYENVLGFQTVTRYPGALFMSTGGYHHHFGLNIWNGERAPAPKENSAGLNWFNLVLPDEETRDNIVANLKEIGAAVEENSDYVEIEDPSGNKIRLVL